MSTVMLHEYKDIHVRVREPIHGAEGIMQATRVTTNCIMYTRTRTIPERKWKGVVKQEAILTDQVVVEMEGAWKEHYGLLIRITLDVEDLRQILDNFDMYKQLSPFREEI
jgi:hypothetical protein